MNFEYCDNTTSRFHDTVFDALYSRSLVDNACWEDPAVDRAALALTPDDTVLVITSAGCNALEDRVHTYAGLRIAEATS